jgi:hypothetical protein
MNNIISIPEFKCLVRAEFLYNLTKGHGSHVPAIIFGVKSPEGKALQFSALLNTGSIFSGLPIHAFITSPPQQELPLDQLQLWDCLSDCVSVEAFGLLEGKIITVTLKNRTTIEGTYLMTFSWSNSFWSEDPTEDKMMHLIALSNGQFAIQPNNRIRVYDQSFVPREIKRSTPDYLLNTHVWRCENGFKWSAGNSDRYHYEIEGSPV